MMYCQFQTAYKDAQQWAVFAPSFSVARNGYMWSVEVCFLFWQLQIGFAW